MLEDTNIDIEGAVTNSDRARMPPTGSTEQPQRFGPWRPLQMIGSGGMADVFLAENDGGVRAALKLIRPHGLTPHRRKLFDRECDLLALLDHPNIVKLLEHGQSADRLWIALQYVAGTSASHLRSARPEFLTPGTVATIAVAVASALDYAHELQVVHRDVKPGNILVTIAPDGSISRVVLSDFGIAMAVGLGDVTYTDAVTGTLGYAAPELLRNLPPVPASDQYSLACTVYALLTGRAPYVAESIAAQVHAQLSSAPPRASRLAQVPAGVDDVLTRAMARNPADRFPSCGAFAAELATTVGIAHGTTPDIDNRPDRGLYEDTIPPGTKQSSTRRSRRLATAAALVAVGVVAAAIAIPALGNSSDDGPDREQRRLSAGGYLCQAVRTSAIADGQPAFRQVTDTQPVNDPVVGAGCRFSAEIPGFDVPASFALGFTEQPPAGMTISSSADGYPSYQSVTVEDGRQVCLAGYRTDVGYLNARTRAAPELCQHVSRALVAFNDLGLTRPAR